VQRDATEKKLIAVIMAQEQYIQEIRDKSMAWDVNQLKQIAQIAPISNGGVISHSATLYSMKMRLSMDPAKEMMNEKKKKLNSGGIDLLNELVELIPQHESIYANKDYDDYEKSISLSSSSSSEDEQVEIMGVDGNLIKRPKQTLL
jgi:hypothetical protein